MPKEIDGYIHRIGRTGRRARKGLATTFINKDSSELILRDLKCLLKAARQRIPPLLYSLEDKKEVNSNEQVGCIYCSGLGHKVIDCLKLQADKRNESWRPERKIYA